MPILIFLFELITTATEPYSTKWDLLNRSNDKTRLNKNLEKKIKKCLEIGSSESALLELIDLTSYS